MPLGAACFLPQGQRGGYGTIRPIDAALPYSPIFFVFLGLPLLFGFHNDDTEKSGKTIATPPETGGHAVPCSGAMRHAPIPAPGGRYRRYLSLREGSEKTPQSGADRAENGPMELRKNWRKLTTALSRFWHRVAGPMNWKTPRPRGGLYRLGNFQRRGLFGG